MGPGVITPGKTYFMPSKDQEDAASMGPGVITPGKLSRRLIHSPHHLRFNGAGSDHSRKARWISSTLSGLLSFNGAGSDHSRKDHRALGF